MSDDDDLDDLLPDDLKPKPKGKAKPLKRTPAQIERAEKKAARDALEAETAALKAAELAAAQQLAQIVNLTIAGHSLSSIGSQIGMTADEVDAMLQRDAARYIRSQPVLRTYVRNWVSGKYSELLEAVWDRATDPTAAENLEAQDRALKILERTARLHGAEAPTQSEVKVDAAPEAVSKMVEILAAQGGMAYDASIFDVVDGEVVEDHVADSAAALEVSRNAVEEEQDGDGEGF